MSEDSRTKWNQRFSTKAHIAPQPPLFVEFMRRFLRAGSLLDIACGDGALALYFAQQGWQVTGVDISDKGLERLQHFAKAEGMTLKALCCDLDELKQLQHPGQFDNIVIGHYKPSPSQWPAIIQLLKDDGTLCISTFNEQQHLQQGFPQRFCLEPNELSSLEGLTLLAQQRVNYEGTHIDNYCFQKSLHVHQ